MSKIRNRFVLAAIGGACVVLTAGCSQHPVTVDTSALRSFAPLRGGPAIRPSDPAAAKIDLGRMLYYDARLSKNQTVSCNSCHPLSIYGADGKPTSTGYAGQRGTRNSPTVYNAALQFVQFWDGRAPDVENQAGGPLLNPIEMGMPSEDAVVAVVASMPEYVTAFRRAFPGEKDPVTFAHVRDAIGSFERGLVTPARWDQFLQGDQAALTAEEKAGFNHFFEAGCATCHSGVLVGGTAFQKLGLAKEYLDASDAGRYEVTQQPADRMYFKVPSLRNVTMTGPYFHNGKVATVEGAVALMAEYQTGKPLTAPDRAAIVAWLKTLTGDIDFNYVKPPELPKSTSKTPRAGTAAGLTVGSPAGVTGG